MELQPKKTPSAKQTRVLKLLLDAVMLVLLVLMYKKQVISLAFHEIGGLALIGGSSSTTLSTRGGSAP